MKTRRLQQQWLSYRANVLPSDAGAVQLAECRRAFFAGAAAFHAEMDKLCGPEHDATVDEMISLDALQDELTQFGRDVKAGVA